MESDVLEPNLVEDAASLVHLQIPEEIIKMLRVHQEDHVEREILGSSLLKVKVSSINCFENLKVSRIMQGRR